MSPVNESDCFLVFSFWTLFRSVCAFDVTSSSPNWAVNNWNTFVLKCTLWKPAAILSPPHQPSPSAVHVTLFLCVVSPPTLFLFLFGTRSLRFFRAFTVEHRASPLTVECLHVTTCQLLTVPNRSTVEDKHCFLSPRRSGAHDDSKSSPSWHSWNITETFRHAP